MKTPDRIDRLLTRLTSSFRKQPSVLAFVLVGSRTAHGAYNATEHSDIEAYCIVSDGSKTSFETYLNEYLKTTGSVIMTYRNQWAGICTVYDDLLRLELPVVERSLMRDTFSRPKKQPVKVLFDRTSGELAGVLDARPDSIDLKREYNYLVEDAWYMLVVSCQYYKKGEYWNARHVMEVVLIPRLVRLMQMESRSDALLLESHKRLEQFLTENHLTIIKTLSVSYDAEAIRTSLDVYLNALPGIARSVAGTYGWVYARDVEKHCTLKLSILLTQP